MNNQNLNDEKREEAFQYQQMNKNVRNPCESLAYEIDSQLQKINNMNFDQKNTLDDNLDNYDSDIDDPRYRPSSNLMENQDENELIVDEDLNNYKTFQKKRIKKSSNSLKNYTVRKYTNSMKRDNIFHKKSILELENENELLKEELFKRAQIIKNKDEVISEFQGLLTIFKSKFEQYEAKNNQLKQQI